MLLPVAAYPRTTNHPAMSRHPIWTSYSCASLAPTKQHPRSKKNAPRNWWSCAAIASGGPESGSKIGWTNLYLINQLPKNSPLHALPEYNQTKRKKAPIGGKRCLFYWSEYRVELASLTSRVCCSYISALIDVSIFLGKISAMIPRQKGRKSRSEKESRRPVLQAAAPTARGSTTR
jgi:hypothetical protein